MAKAMEILTDEEFYRTRTARFISAMLELSDVGEVIDQITLTERLKARSEIDAVGGSTYWRSSCKRSPPPPMSGTTSKIVRDKALLRS